MSAQPPLKATHEAWASDLHTLISIAVDIAIDVDGSRNLDQVHRLSVLLRLIEAMAGTVHDQALRLSEEGAA